VASLRNFAVKSLIKIKGTSSITGAFFMYRMYGILKMQEQFSYMHRTCSILKMQEQFITPPSVYPPAGQNTHG